MSGDNNGAVAAALLGVAVAVDEVDVENTNDSNNDNNDILSHNTDNSQDNDQDNDTDNSQDNDVEDSFNQDNDVDSSQDNDSLLSNNNLFSNNTDNSQDNDSLLSNNDLFSNNTDNSQDNDQDNDVTSSFNQDNDVTNTTDNDVTNTTDNDVIDSFNQDNDVVASNNTTSLDINLEDIGNTDICDTDWIDLDNVGMDAISLISSDGHAFSINQISEMANTGDMNVTINNGGWSQGGAQDADASVDGCDDFGVDSSPEAVAEVDASFHAEISMGANIQYNVVNLNVIGNDGTVNDGDA